MVKNKVLFEKRFIVIIDANKMCIMIHMTIILILNLYGRILLLNPNNKQLLYFNSNITISINKLWKNSLGHFYLELKSTSKCHATFSMKIKPKKSVAIKAIMVVIMC